MVIKSGIGVVYEPVNKLEEQVKQLDTLAKDFDALFTGKITQVLDLQSGEMSVRSFAKVYSFHFIDSLLSVSF